MTTSFKCNSGQSSKSRNYLNFCIPYGDENHKWPQILILLCVSLSSLTFGALFAWTSPSIAILTSNSSHIGRLTSEEASYLTMLPPLASILISPIFAFLLDKIGRKKIVIFISIPYIICWTLIILAENIWTFYVARFFSGIGDAAFFTSVPMYVGEIATPKVRGTWGNIVTVGVYLGATIINIIGGCCDIRTTGYVCICIPIIQILTSFLIPESPYFLLMKDQQKEARDSLMKLRWNKNIDAELATLTGDVKRQLSEGKTWKDLFLVKTNRKAFLISIGLRGTQQLSGLGTFSIYTQKFFNQAGGHISASISSIIFSSSLTLLITSFAFVVDKFGRKSMMIFSSFGCGVILAIEAIYAYINEKTEIDVSDFKWIPLAGMLVYLVINSSGLGILPTLMLGELFSASVKGKALCATNMVFGVYILTISKAFQALCDKLGLYVPLVVFSICCFLSVVFSYLYVPETKGKTLEEVQQDLRGENHDKNDLIISKV